MKKARAFLDTNIIVYAFVDDPRSVVAQELLKERCDTSVQALNEFTHVARRKLGMSWTEIRAATRAVTALCGTITTISLETHIQALVLAEQYRFSTYDALMIASALGGGSDLFYSEDLQHGQAIGPLRIVNPFF